jgi:nucleotide-binding universal stress UspA family protein
MTTQIKPTTSLARVAAAVDSYPEGRDATVLAAAITQATGAELMLLAVEPDLPLIIPGLQRDQVRRETEAMLTQTRTSLAPGARLKITSDLSVPRGLERLARAQHRDLVVVGSSRRGPHGVVSIGGRTRQLIDDLQSALAIAPRGLSRHHPVTFRRIGIGYDGGPEAQAALAAAAQIAAGAGADLIVRGVIDDRVPALGWPSVWMGEIMESWKEMMDEEEEQLRADIEEILEDGRLRATVDLARGRPATSLHDLSKHVDLLVIGSRRWGPLARLVLGGTGERLVHGAECSLLIVPRPASDS